MKKQTVMNNILCSQKGTETMYFPPDIFMMILA